MRNLWQKSIKISQVAAVIDTVLPKLNETVAGAMVFFVPTSNIYYIE
jgi:hypothetical protein